MNKNIIFCFIFLLFSIGLSAQLKLNVQGNAAIQGNLSMGNPNESNISGLDQLAGYNDLRFSATGSNTDMTLHPSGFLGIGPIAPGARLHVYNTTGIATAINGTSSISSTLTRGILGVSELAIDRGIGVEGVASGTTGQQAGMEATSTGGGNAVRIGVIGRVSGSGHTGLQYGTYGWILSTEATGPRYAVYGLTTGTGAGVQYAGYFVGDVTVTGTFDNASDEKLKKNIKSLDKAMDRIMALKPVRYEFRTGEYPQMNLAEGQQMGFIAQDVGTIFPELIKDNFHPEVPKKIDDNGTVKDYYPAVDYKGLNYLGLIPVLTKATQEQQEEIEKLETRLVERDRLIATLEDRLARLEQVVEKLAGEASGSSAQTIPVTSADLRQNQPNPFTETTLIKYAIPDNVNQAELQITDVNGRLLKTIVIDQRGEGTTRIQAQSLSAGTYFYSLVLDGRALESKKMVLTK